MNLPDGLQRAGKRLWADVTDRADLDPGEAVILEAAARTADELERLEAELVAGQLVVSGSTGQPRAHPLLDEVRKHRALLAGLLRQLEPAEAETNGASASAWGREAARARWSRHRPRVVS